MSSDKMPRITEHKPTLDYEKTPPRRERLDVNWKDWRLIPAALIALACFVYLVWRMNVVLGPG